MSAASAYATNVGDTYQQVLTEKGNPKSQMEAGAMRMLTYPDSVIKLKDDVVVSIKVVGSPVKAPQVASPDTSRPTSGDPQISGLLAQLDDAVAKVKRIVNQEVRPVPKDPNLQFWEFYFHDGATRPNFNTVDVRRTRETPYDSHGYILWRDGPPDVMWDGKQLEFNSMTKYFYADHKLPKKKLTEQEMLEINRLYRIIGQTEKQLADLGYKGTVP